MLERLVGYAQASLVRFHNLSKPAKTAVIVYFVTHFTISFTLFLLGPQRIFAAAASWAQELRESTFGFLWIIAACTLSAIPPLTGYSMLVTVCGFAWGLNGWFIATTGCLVGSAVSFKLCRSFMKRFAHFLDASPHLLALGHAVRSKGLLLIILIRFSPFPFPLSNLFFASIKTISLSQFLLATLVISPKILLHVWIGSRLYLLADPTENEKLDPTAKWINGIYIVLGIIVGICTSWYVYRLTMRYADQGVINDLEEGGVHLGGGLLDDFELNEDEVIFDADANEHGSLRINSSTTSLASKGSSSENELESNNNSSYNLHVRK